MSLVTAFLADKRLRAVSAGVSLLLATEALHRALGSGRAVGAVLSHVPFLTADIAGTGEHTRVGAVGFVVARFLLARRYMPVKERERLTQTGRS